VYADDGYIKTKLSVTLQVLTEFKSVFKEVTGLELNVVKTVILTWNSMSLRQTYRLRVVRSRLRSMLRTASLLPAPH
jgi:hypothetical protein